MIWLLVTGVGLFVAARQGRGPDDYSGPMVWHEAPVWARVLFGHVNRSVNPYRLVGACIGLIWVALAGLGLAAGVDQGSAAYEPLVECAVVVLVAGVGLFPLIWGVGLWRFREPEQIRAGEDGESGEPGESPLEVTFRVRLGDLYWTWATSRLFVAGCLFSWALGLVLLSAPLTTPTAPLVADVAAGALLLVLGPMGPLLLIFDHYKAAWRRTVHLVFDDDGVAGWPAPVPGRMSWRQLQRPRLESQVLVLPFVVYPLKVVVAVPPRAFTPEQFERLVGLMRSQGFFLDGDHRSAVGRLIGAVAARHPQSSQGGAMASFPRLEANATQIDSKPPPPK